MVIVLPRINKSGIRHGTKILVPLSSRTVRASHLRVESKLLPDMRNVIFFAVVVSIASYADGRVYYLENFDGVRNNEAIYPIVEQQASRDLDLAFSAGDPVENENVVSPTRKVYTLIAPEKPYIESNRDADRSTANYKLTEPAPTRRGNFDDIILVPQGARKLMKLNGNNKGEVILELRVIANHDST